MTLVHQIRTACQVFCGKWQRCLQCTHLSKYPHCYNHSIDQEGSLDDDDDAHSDHMYQSSTISDSTTRNPTIEDSKNSSFNQALHPPLLGMQSRTASLTPAVATAGSGEMTSFVDMHTAIGPHSNVTGDKTATKQCRSTREQPWVATFCSSQPTAYHSSKSFCKCTLPFGASNGWAASWNAIHDKYIYRQIYPSAATVVEAAHEADTTDVPASSSVDQPLAVSCKVVFSAVPSMLTDMHRQDFDYLCSHHFISSNILPWHPDSMEPSDRMPMELSKRAILTRYLNVVWCVPVQRWFVGIVQFVTM